MWKPLMNSEYIKNSYETQTLNTKLLCRAELHYPRLESSCVLAGRLSSNLYATPNPCTQTHWTSTELLHLNHRIKKSLSFCSPVCLERWCGLWVCVLHVGQEKRSKHGIYLYMKHTSSTTLLPYCPPKSLFITNLTMCSNLKYSGVILLGLFWWDVEFKWDWNQHRFPG